jgi:hypothetical protein
MKRLLFLFAIISLSLPRLFAVTPLPCLGGVSVSTFRLLLQPEGKNPALPLGSVNIIQPGGKLKYEPIHVPAAIKDKAQIAILLVPAPKASGKEAAVSAGHASAGSAGADSSSATVGPGEAGKGDAAPPDTAGSQEEKGKDKQRNLVILEARPAKEAAEWVIPVRASIVGVIFGPRGLDVKKVSSMVEKNQDLIPEVALTA